MDNILYLLCRHCVNIMDGYRPYPATVIARQLGMNVGKVRYHLRKLKEAGYVESFYDGGMTEDREVYCNWGFGITEKAHRTEEYRTACEVEQKLWNTCFNTIEGDTHGVK